MTERTVIVHAKVVVEGQVWSIDVQAQIGAKTGKELAEGIRNAIGFLSKEGFRPTGLNGGGDLDKPPQYATEPMPEQKAIPGPPIPICENCKGKMKLSTIQDDEAIVKYFCPRKMATGYCKWRGSTDIITGELKTWEVKK